MNCFAQRLANALNVPVASKVTRLMVIYRFEGEIDESAIIERNDDGSVIIEVDGAKFLVDLERKMIYHK